MKLTVLGKYGPFPAPGGACSGYLLESDSIKLVLDLGSGTLSRLLQVCDLKDITAIFLTHLHSDHISDMYVLSYALMQLKAKGISVPIPLSVVAPDKPQSEFRQLSSCGVFDMISAEDGLKYRFADTTVALHRTIHPVTAFAIEISRLQKRMIYTGDAGYSDNLLKLCINADLLLADTNYLHAEKTTEVAPHLTAREAGLIAAEANVKRLVCTHIWGGSPIEEILLKEAREAFPNAEIASELATYDV